MPVLRYTVALDGSVVEDGEHDTFGRDPSLAAEGLAQQQLAGFDSYDNYLSIVTQKRQGGVVVATVANSHGESAWTLAWKLRNGQGEGLPFPKAGRS